MSAPAPLANLISEWRRLTDAESEAIGTQAWLQLLEVQAAKAGLQTAILLWERENAPSSLADFPSLRPLLGELIGLESRNRERLARVHAEARAERASLERSRRDLRRLQGSFTSRTSPGWETYS